VTKKKCIEFQQNFVNTQMQEYYNR